MHLSPPPPPAPPAHYLQQAPSVELCSCSLCGTRGSCLRAQRAGTKPGTDGRYPYANAPWVQLSVVQFLKHSMQAM